MKNLEEIVLAADGAMVARGDLGAQIPLEQVPSAQQRIVQVCRQLNYDVHYKVVIDPWALCSELRVLLCILVR